MGQRVDNQGRRITAIRLVAAVDTPIDERNAADWLCLGSNDGVIINAALGEVSSVGGKVVLAPGNYVLGSVGIIVPTLCSLEGPGQAAVVSGTATYLLTVMKYAKAANFKLSGGTYNHIRITDDAILATLLDIASVNPGLAHLYRDDDINSRSPYSNPIRIIDLYYERPEDEPKADYDLLPSGKGTWNSSGGVVSVEERLQELLRFKEKTEAALQFLGVSI